MGATSELSARATGPALECRTRQQAKVLGHVTGSLANFSGKYSPGSSLVETKAARAHTPGPDNLITVQQQVEQLEQRLEVEMKSFPKTQRAMSDDEPEVKVVDDEPEVEVVDISLEDSPALPEEARANARSP